MGCDGAWELAAEQGQSCFESEFSNKVGGGRRRCRGVGRLEEGKGKEAEGGGGKEKQRRGKLKERVKRREEERRGKKQGRKRGRKQEGGGG